MRSEKKSKTNTLLKLMIAALCAVAIVVGLVLAKKSYQQKNSYQNFDKQPAIEVEHIPYEIVDVKPLFNGQDADGFSEWITHQVQSSKHIDGYQTVELMFLITSGGELSDISVVSTTSEQLSDEIVGIVQSSPAWTPGESDGKKVNVWYSVELSFGEESDDDEEVIGECENLVPPKFKGENTQAFSRWVSDHIVYPIIAQNNGIQGRVILTIRIDEKGRVKAEVETSVDPALDKEALRVVESSNGMWTPGTCEGENVTFRYSFPVSFTLAD